MSLHPKWRSLLPSREQAPLSPRLFSVCDNKAIDDLVGESGHEIGARGDFDQLWIQ